MSRGLWDRHYTSRWSCAWRGGQQQMLPKGFFWSNSVSGNGLNVKEVLIPSPSTKWCLGVLWSVLLGFVVPSRSYISSFCLRLIYISSSHTSTGQKCPPRSPGATARSLDAGRFVALMASAAHASTTQPPSAPRPPRRARRQPTGASSYFHLQSHPQQCE